MKLTVKTPSHRGAFRRPGTSRPARRRVAWRPILDPLEDRALMATISVSAGQVVRPVNDQILGVNLAWWDVNLSTAQTRQMVKDAGLTLFRFPGGSSSDEYHFNEPASYPGKATAPDFARFIESVGGRGLVTLNYGTGSPQQAAAFLAYLNAPVGNTTQIGVGPQWSNGSWRNVDWKSASYWAGLRAATPLAQDDGLNFLRIGHAAPFGFHYYEVGNEQYGSWETDYHAIPHDPATYVTFAKQFATLAASIDPTISIGINSGSVSQDNNWTGNVLSQGVAQGFVPGFISDHHYMQAPYQENDANLLLNTSNSTANQDPSNPMGWAARAAGYRSLLQQKLGAAAGQVELLATEFNSVYASPGKQTTSLVNGLFLADSLGSLLNTEYNGANVWDLRNNYEYNNSSSNLYGWRTGGDYGLIGRETGSAPATGAYTPYPTYFAEQLVSKMVHTGDTVVPVRSDDPYLSVYGVKQANGHLSLLVINKSATSDLTGTFLVSGFQPGATAQAWQYGKVQDTAQSQTADGRSALANFTASLSTSGSNFGYSFPSYSMTLLDLAPGTGGPPDQAPTVAVPASANPGAVTGTTTTLAALGADDGGESGLTYTWSTTGTPPAPVAFSANGSNASKNVVATFTRAGNYGFVVTVRDAGGLTATSTVTVQVSPTLSRVAVSPGSANVVTGATQAFTAQATDQFGLPLATQPAFTWTVATGGGSISTTGTYTAPNTAGSATVRAASGSVAGTGAVTITAPGQSGVSIAYRVTNDWGTGYTGEVAITNTGTTVINGWTLQFDTSATITGIWNAQQVSRSGTRYTVKDAGYNATIAPGQTVTFGFQATGNAGATKPTNFALNGGPSTPPPTPTPASFSVGYRVTNDWGSGFTGEVAITNTGTTAINGWTLQFDSGANITGIWNAQQVSRSGRRYTVKDAGYNATIAPGQTVTFGFQATGSAATTRPTNFVLNGAAPAGSGAGTGTASLAAASPATSRTASPATTPTPTRVRPTVLQASPHPTSPPPPLTAPTSRKRALVPPT